MAYGGLSGMSFLSAIDMPAAWAHTTGPMCRDGGGGGRRRALTTRSGGQAVAGHDFVSELDYANDGDGRDADASDPGDWVTLAESRWQGIQWLRCGEQLLARYGHCRADCRCQQQRAGCGGHPLGCQGAAGAGGGQMRAVLGDLLDGVRWAAGLPVAGRTRQPQPGACHQSELRRQRAWWRLPDLVSDVTTAGGVAGGGGGQ